MEIQIWHNHLAAFRRYLKLVEVEITLEKRVWGMPSLREEKAATDGSMMENEVEVRSMK